MNYCITMTGHICSGKSSLIKKLTTLKNFKVVNTDKHIYDKVIDGTHFDYPASFKAEHSIALMQFNEDVRNASKSGETIIIDRLNTNLRSRTKILDEFRTHKNICINMKTTWVICRRRYDKLEALYRRSNQPNLYRSIPEDILSEMGSNLSVPSLREGYDAIINITSDGKLYSVEGDVCDLVSTIMYELQ